MTEADARVTDRQVWVDNGGKPWTLTTKPVNVATSTEQEPAWQIANEAIDLRLDPATGQAPWSRGQVEVVADVSAANLVPATVDFLVLEINVIGVVGGVRTVIARFALGGDKLVGRVPLRDPYQKIEFEYRQLNPTTEGPNMPSSVGFFAVARLYR